MWSRENDFNAEIASAASTYGVAVPLVKAIIGAESAFNPMAYRAEAPRPSLPPTPDFPDGGDASLGLMQLLVRTARGLGYTGSVQGLYIPSVNVRLGTKLLAENLKRSSGNVQSAVSAYNGGYRPSLGFGAPLPNGQYGNQVYVDRVMKYFRYFEGQPVGGGGESPATFPDSGESLVGNVAEAPPVIPPLPWWRKMLAWVRRMLRGNG